MSRMRRRPRCYRRASFVQPRQRTWREHTPCTACAWNRRAIAMGGRPLLKGQGAACYVWVRSLVSFGVVGRWAATERGVGRRAIFSGEEQEGRWLLARRHDGSKTGGQRRARPARQRPLTRLARRRKDGLAHGRGAVRARGRASRDRHAAALDKPRDLVVPAKAKRWRQVPGSRHDCLWHSRKRGRDATECRGCPRTLTPRR